ncbi:MAG: hypothetical protein ACRELU_01950 [Gemmatimonadota bacterium]
MSLSPIARVLSTIRGRRVQSLLMGGQACILYGAAEFSRDADLAVFASRDNLENLSDALSDLAAEVVAVPPFEIEYLERGHAVHFRCRHPDLRGVRLDIMTRMRGVDPFPDLWERRTTFPIPEGLDVEAMSLPDLVASKKTQRDKDWPMIRRLVEANYEQFFAEPGEERVRFWLEELRTPELLVECASRFADAAGRTAAKRPAVAAALFGDEAETALHLEKERAREMETDRAYWVPLRAELEALRRERRRKTR